jgi:hypothetical protein
MLFPAIDADYAHDGRLSIFPECSRGRVALIGQRHTQSSESTSDCKQKYINHVVMNACFTLLRSYWRIAIVLSTLKKRGSSVTELPLWEKASISGGSNP